MSVIEILACALSVVAIGIGIIAIWLSIVFYKMTTELAGSTKEAAKDIGASVERLETLFSTLYADTFSMMKETVTDMRKHIWPEKEEASEKISEEAEKRADEKVKALKEEVDSEVTKLLARQSRTDAKVDSIKGELEEIVDRVIDQSRKLEIEARQDTLKERIIREAKLLNRREKGVGIKADTLVNRVNVTLPDVSAARIVDTIRELEADGVFHWKDETLGPNTKILM